MDRGGRKVTTMDVTLYRGDCLDFIPTLSDGAIDLVLTDPPYSSGGLFAGDRRQSTGVKYADKKYHGIYDLDDFSGDNMDQRSFTSFMRELFARCRPKMKPGAIAAAFCDWRNLPAMTDAIQMGGLVWRGVAVWNKGAARNQPGRYRADCEFLVWGTNGPRPIAGPGCPAVPGCYSISSIPSSLRLHQAEKPLALMRALMAVLPPAQGLVFDPFMGSGTTGEAAIMEGFDFIGCEIMPPPIFDIARERLNRAQAQVSILDTLKDSHIEQGDLWEKTV